MADAAPFTGLLSRENYELILRDVEHVLGLDPGSVTDMEVGLARGAHYFAALRRRPAPGAEMLAAALGERLREVLPASFEIAVKGEVLSVRSQEASMVAMVGVAFRLPLPRDAQLELELRMFARDIAEFVRDATGDPWPEGGAEPQVRVDPNEARIWWDTPGRAQPVLNLRPLNRAEINT